MILRALFGFALLLFICNVYCNNWVIFKSSKKIGTKSNEKVLTFLFESQITGTIYNEKKFWFTFKISNANIAHNVTSIDEISEDLNENFWIKIKFWPEIFQHKAFKIELLSKHQNDFQNSLKNISTPTDTTSTIISTPPLTNISTASDDIKNKKLPWELNLIFVPSTYCHKSDFKSGEICDVKFFLKTYSLLTTYRLVENNSSTKVTKNWKPDVLNWQWSSENKSAFRCAQSTLEFDTTTHQYGVTFKDLRVAAIITTKKNKEKIEFPKLSKNYKNCELNVKTGSTFWSKLYNISNLIENSHFIVIILIIVVILVLWRKHITSKKLQTSGNYNIAISPFSLDEFDDIDIDYTNNVKNKKGMIRRIY